MNTNDFLLKYLNTVSEDPIKELIDNSMYYMFANQIKAFGYNDNKWKTIDKAFSILNKYTLDKIVHQFDVNNIDYIAFKGVVLSFQLYEDLAARKLGDIDIYVNEYDFKKALLILTKMGYMTKYRNGLENKHHVVLINKNTVVELHRNIFHPIIKINESYLLANKCLKLGISTFNTTAALLHLIYHLYMDSYLSFNNIYSIDFKANFKIAPRFLYRAYEIALFAEKYFKDIKWNDIISDIKTQQLRIVFKYMVEDILEIFPNAFPAKLVDVINSLEYVSEQNDDVYKIIRAAKAAHDNNGHLVLSKYIDENWNYNNTATCKHLGECFEISKPVGEESCENKRLSCELLIDRCEKGISLQFTVSDDDFYVSDYNNFGTLESDGVHLLLCGTQKYTYMSIFLVPKIKNDSIEVFAYDVLNNTVIDSMDIQARIQKYDDYYILQAVLSNEFLSRHEIDKYFYAGFVISDCDIETKYRKNALVSAEPATEWYNPLHFLKIDLLD